MSEPSSGVEQALLGFFERRRADGVYVHADEDVRAFIPLAVVRLGIAVQPGTSLATVLEEALAHAGLPVDTPLSAAAPAITAMCERRPAVLQIYAEFMEHLRSSGQSAAPRRRDDEQAKTLRRLLLPPDGAVS